ncbi:MAG: antibiotic biosynthesis monooxygenase [Pseudomonadales bacterium]|nr:antibiotic biosynthesis monooxygenase [Pseudomonadales bacterium]
MTIAIIARLNVAKGKETEFETTMLGLAADVRAKEPGNQLYTLCKDADGNYLVMELYASAEALAAHGQSEHFKAAGKKFAGLMAGAPEIQRLEVVG